ncbi:MAG TPA: hypothetical protein VLM37_00345 [Fibrobacteraceae bacterium]|nr:hypothetical protein [Fibrobacteraceae bacterium]
MEKRIPLHGLADPEGIADLIEATAEAAHREGWFFVSSAADQWLESVVLFFERDLEV